MNAFELLSSIEIFIAQLGDDSFENAIYCKYIFIRQTKRIRIEHIFGVPGDYNLAF